MNDQHPATGVVGLCPGALKFATRPDQVIGSVGSACLAPAARLPRPSVSEGVGLACRAGRDQRRRSTGAQPEQRQSPERFTSGQQSVDVIGGDFLGDVLL